MNSNLPLANKTILITRPAQLANSLRQRIAEAGGTAKAYPVIKINDVGQSEKLRSIIDNLSEFYIAIFISPTAVIKTFEKIKYLPVNLMLAVIGSSTQTMLSKYGYQAQIVPDEFDTESLLQHLSLQQNNITGKKIVIFRGEGGRDLLANTLTQRGANVTYAEIYRRDMNQLGTLTQDQLNKIDALTVTSNQGLQHLFDLTDEDSKSLLTTVPIIVPGNRAHKLAAQLGFSRIIPASNATDDACMQALISEFSSK